MTVVFPRPGPALKGLLGAILVLGIVEAFLYHYVAAGAEIFGALACTTRGVLGFELWRLVTAGFLTRPDAMGHLLFTLLGLYFLSPDLERRWGPWRFLGFIVGSMAAGFIFSIAIDLIAPDNAPQGFHPGVMFGATAAIASTAVAWSLANAHLEVRLFFFLPIKGKTLLWITIGFCLLGLLYPTGIPEGVAAPFGGVVVGLLFGGQPSPARRLWLKLRLERLARESDKLARDRERRKRRAQGPALRVVRGGRDSDGPDQPDKRTLN